MNITKILVIALLAVGIAAPAFADQGADEGTTRQEVRKDRAADKRKMKEDKSADWKTGPVPIVDR